jgi:succinyl-diaminopimelate desuccinylase
MRNDDPVSTSLDLTGDLGELTLALVNVPSESRQEGALADLVESALSSFDHLKVTRVGNNVVAQVGGLGQQQTVLLGGHLDTVPSSGNLPGRIDGDCVWRLGSCDMKGGVAVALKLAAMVVKPAPAVTYVFYECEEIVSSANGLGVLQKAKPDLLQADLAILLEPTNGLVEAGCQGVARVKVHVDGKRAHVARWWLGQNAIHGLAPILDAVQRAPERKPVIDGLEYREAMQVVGVEGGVASNVVPDQAWVEISHRFAPDRSSDEALAHVRSVVAGAVGSGETDDELARVGVHLEVVDVEAAAPPNLTNPLLKKFVSHAGAEVNPKHGWTDVACFAAMNVAAVNFGPGDPKVAHTNDEHVPIAQLNSVYQTLHSYLTG